MAKQIFVTGTNTGIGKTFVSAGLCRALCLANPQAKNSYIKPFATGVSPHNEDLDFVTSHVSSENFQACCFSEFSEPASPYIAAKKEGKVISLKEVLKKCYDAFSRNDFCVIEGAGGLMVPVTDKHTILDFIKQLNVEVLLVAHYGLGTINHTLLSVMALKAAGIKIKGIVLNEPDDVQVDLYQEAVSTNAQEIERLSQQPVLARVPFQAQINDAVFGELLKSL